VPAAAGAAEADGEPAAVAVPADGGDAGGLAAAGKPALASKAVWGGIVAVVAALLPVVGPALGLDATGQGHVLETVAAIGCVIGGLVAIWGRLSARTPIR